MKYCCTLVFALMFYHAGGQVPIWNVMLDLSAGSNSFQNTSIIQSSIQLRGDRFLVYSQQRILELDQSGTVTAAAIGPNYGIINGYGEFIREQTDPQTGESYFLVASSGGSNSGAFLSIREYHPGLGFIHATSLNEELGGSSSSPFFLALNDSVLFILGKKYFRQVTHHTNHSLVVNWQIDNTIGNPSGGVLSGDSIVGITQDGHIFALDLLGNTLWNQSAPLGLTHIEKVDHGFLACNRTSVAPYAASVIRFSADGMVEWAKSFPDRSYEFLLAEPDGTISVTGTSDSSKVVLHHLDQTGNTIWRKTYQTGRGTALLRAPDGGYALSGLLGIRYLIIKTDHNGLTAPVEMLPLPTERKIENSLLSSAFLPSATLFFNGSQPTFFVPKENMTTLFFAAAPWLGGLDQDSVLHFAASTFIIGGESDYRPGLAQTPAADFNRVWAVSRAAIESLQQDWLDNGIIDQLVPYDVLTWPAKGNLDFKYNLNFSKTTVHRDLLPAPFIDINGDGKYSVYDGDYPRIKGDQMAWWIITDSTLHTRTNSIPLVLDVSVSAYVYDCLQTEQLNNSLFVDFEFINRSSMIYGNMFAGIWSDPDLGCAYDDYIGSLPANNAFYVYNQDAVDGQSGTTCPGGAPTYGEAVPVGSISFTNVALNKFIYYNNGTTTPAPLPNTTDPNTAEEHNFYLQGKWRDGTTPTYNGQPIDFIFPDNPADPMGNSMCASNLAAGDRRALGSHGPFTFAPNDTFRLSTAFTYHPNIPLPCPDIFGTVKNDLEALHTLLNSGALDAPVHLLSNVQLSPGQSALLDATVPSATGYTWSNGATTATISVAQAGAYSVTITRSTGCASVETVLVTAATPTHEADWLDDLRIFPNPSAGQFKVEMRGAAQSSVECTLYNSLGQFVQRQVVDFSSGAGNYTFNCAYLPTGIYTLRLRAGEKMRHERVVLQH